MKAPPLFDAALIAALPALRRFCRKLTTSRHEAEDLEQTVVASALRHRTSFTGTGMAAWLCRIAYNRRLSDVRLSRIRCAHVTADDVPFDMLPQMASPAPQETRLQLRDALRVIAAAPDIHRDALIAIRLKGEGHAEYAARIGISEGTSKTRVHRMDKRLAQVVA